MLAQPLTTDFCFLEQVRSNGDYLRISLQGLAEKHGQGEVRGRGLLLALGLDGVSGSALVQAASQCGLLACHVRSHVRGGRTTQPEHMPSTHRAHAEWTPSRILGWAATVGENTRLIPSPGRPSRSTRSSRRLTMRLPPHRSGQL